MMSKKILPVSALALALAPMPAAADPAVGIGLNLTFGSNGTDMGAGLRVFSDDQKDKAAASLGLDYMFKSKSVRASVGAAYLMDNSYVEVNTGYNFKQQAFDFGVGGGFVETVDHSLSSTALGCPLCGKLFCNC